MGPSGSGKTAITAKVFPKSAKVISHTTRKKRPGEVDGRDYYFETQASFQHLIDTNQLAEYDQYHDNFYGVGISQIIEATKEQAAYDVLTFNGFEAIYQKFGDKIIPIFFDVSRENVLARLMKRESRTAIIEERLNLYDEEIQLKCVITKYPNCHIVNANKSFPKVVKEVQNIVASYQH